MTTPGPGHPTGTWFSYQRHVATSGQTNFLFSSINGYVSSEDLTVWVNGTQLATSAYTLNLAQTRIEFPAPGRTAGDIVVIRRVTGPLMADRQVVFSDSTILVSADLNESALQLLHLSQEAIDTAFNALTLDNTLSNFTARSLRVKDMLPAVDGTDAVNKNQLDQFVLGQVQNNTIPLNKLVQVGANTVLGNNTASTGNITSFTCTPLARTLIDDATQGEMQTTLGIAGKLFNLNPQIFGAGAVSRVYPNAPNPSPLCLEFDLAQIDTQRFAILDTFQRRGSRYPSTNDPPELYGAIYGGSADVPGTYIALSNSSGAQINFVLFHNHIKWGPYPDDISSGLASPNDVNLPWDFPYGSSYGVETYLFGGQSTAGNAARAVNGGLHSIANGGKFYFPGSGVGWGSPGNPWRNVASAMAPTTGAQGIWVGWRCWLLRLN
jgi:hypothetical protein